MSEEQNKDAQENATSNENVESNDNNETSGKMSSKSSDISIEEIGPEDDAANVEKADDAEELIPEIGKELEVVKSDEKKAEESEEEEEDDDDDVEDETLWERIVGLSEMFPAGLTDAVCSGVKGSVSGIKWAYSSGRSLSWVVFSSATIMFLPIMIETERVGIEEAQKQQQRQILLGPGAAMAGGPGNAQANAPLPSAPS